MALALALALALAPDIYLQILSLKLDFNQDTNYGYDHDILKSKIINHKPNNLATLNTVHTNIIIILNIEDIHLNIRHSYLEIAFIVSNNVGGVFANDAIIRLVNCSMMALFSSVKLETSGGSTIEFIDDCHLYLCLSC